MTDRSIMAKRKPTPIPGPVTFHARARTELTIGFAHWGDYNGVWGMINALIDHHDLRRVELLAIGNDPEGLATRRLQRRAAQFGHNIGGFRALHYPDVPGPSGAKNKVFEEAGSPVVWLVDAHVSNRPGSVDRARNYFARNPETRDLYCGPLIHDNGVQRDTHLNAVWSGQAHGTWGAAWLSPSGEHVSVVCEQQGRLQVIKLVTLVSQQPWPHELNGQHWLHHEGRLMAAGFQALGYDDDAEPFEIWGQGCFSLACRQDAWPGFNERFRFFGGEEGYLHDKVRARGNRVMCLPALAAKHRFNDDDLDPPAYPRPARHLARNVILGLQELGQDTAEAKAHFVASRAMSAEAWDAIEANPDAMLAVDLAPVPPPPAPTIPALFDQTKLAAQGYFYRHMDVLRTMARNVERVEEVSRYPESTMAILAGGPRYVRSHIFGPAAQDPVYPRMQTLMPTLSREVDWFLHLVPAGMDQLTQELQSEELAIQECDLLFYKTDHEYPHLERDLTAWAPKVKKLIVLHDTYRPVAGQPGDLMPAVEAFCKSHPDWFVVSQSTVQFGLTTLAYRVGGRPEHQVVIRPWIHGKGPGAKLKALLAAIGVQAKAGCRCDEHIAAMNKWGPEGCRQNMKQILQWLKEDGLHYSLGERVKAGAMAALPESLGGAGLALRINPVNPMRSLVKIAIEQYEAEQAAEPAV